MSHFVGNLPQISQSETKKLQPNQVESQAENENKPELTKKPFVDSFDNEAGIQSALVQTFADGTASQNQTLKSPVQTTEPSVYSGEPQKHDQDSTFSPSPKNLKQEPRKMLHTAVNQGQDAPLSISEADGITKGLQKPLKKAFRKIFMKAHKKSQRSGLSEADELFWDQFLEEMTFMVKFFPTEDGITLEISPDFIPKLLQEPGSQEWKDFPQLLGEKFAGWLSSIKKKVASLPKGSLSSFRVWDAVFNRGLRSKYATRPDTMELIEKLMALEMRLDCHAWVLHFLEFLRELDPITFRNDEAVENVERKLVYEMMAKILKFAGSVVEDIIRLTQSLAKIDSFSIVKANKSIVVLRFRTESAEFDKGFLNVLNGIKGNISLQRNEIARPPRCNVEDMIEDFMISPDVLENIGQEVQSDHDIGESNLTAVGAADHVEDFTNSENSFRVAEDEESHHLHLNEEMRDFIEVEVNSFRDQDLTVTETMERWHVAIHDGDQDADAGNDDPEADSDNDDGQIDFQDGNNKQDLSTEREELENDHLEGYDINALIPQGNFAGPFSPINVHEVGFEEEADEGQEVDEDQTETRDQTDLDEAIFVEIPEENSVATLTAAQTVAHGVLDEDTEILTYTDWNNY